MDDEEDGSAVDGTATDEDSSDRSLGPWDSTMQPSDSGDGSDGEDDEWGVSPDDRPGGGNEEAGEDEAGDEEAGEEDDDGDGNVAGALAPDVPVEPDRPDPVNVLFVVLGAYLGVVAIASLVGAGGSFTVIEYAAVTVGFFALAGLVYGFLTRGNPDT